MARYQKQDFRGWRPSRDSVKILQGSIDRGNTAMDMMYKVAEETSADIVSMAEPTKKRGSTKSGSAIIEPTL